MFRVEAHYPFDFDTFVDNDERIKKVAGMETSDSGTGFAVRDLGWQPLTWEQAIELKHKLDSVYVDGGLTVQIMEK